MRTASSPDDGSVRNEPATEQNIPRGRSFSEKDYRISAVRFVAFCMIVCCHFLQFYGNALAWWFNVGVQIFLFISGCLYGGKYADARIDCLSFYKKRFLRILLPYYLVLAPLLFVHFFLLHAQFSKRELLQIVLCNAFVPGGDHLWFVSAILMCYLLTPLFCVIFRGADRKRFLLSFVCVTAALFIFFYFFAPYYNVAWILCYYLGYVFGWNEKKQYVRIGILYAVFLLLSLQNVLQILNTIRPVVNTDTNIYALWYSLNHVWLGIVLFIVLRKLFSKRNPPSRPIKKVLDLSDRYSYSGYLIHPFLMIAPLLSLTACRIVNIGIVLLLICVLSVLLTFFGNKISALFARVFSM